MRENYPVIWGLLKGVGLLGVALAGTMLVGSFLQSRALIKSAAVGTRNRSFIAQDKSPPRSNTGSLFEPGHELFTPDIVAGR